MAQSRHQFLQLGLYPLTESCQPGLPLGPTPFYWFGKKASSTCPYTWIVDGYHDATLDYLPRRMRFAPMPVGAIGVSYTAIATPPRIVATDIDSGDHTTDPGKKLPVPNGWMEIILLPIIRQQMTGSGLFKNEESKREIARAYGVAVGILEKAKGGGGGMVALYPQ
jgi:hypothetical protein